MIIKALILSTMLSSDPIIITMPPDHKIEARRRNKRGQRGKRLPGGGLR